MIKKIIKKIFNIKIREAQLLWHTIEAGPLKNYRLYGDGNASWLKEMIRGIYDKELFEIIGKLNLQDKTVVEIGAHIGYHTLGFGKEVGPHGKVFSIEPNPYNAERLRKNIHGNKELEDRIDVLEMALSDKDGQEEFVFGHRVDKGSSSGSFLDRSHTIWKKDIYESEKVGFKRMEVTTRSLDSIRKNGTIKNPISLCKIDVEGGEYLVLEGAKETLGIDKPIILIEIHSIFNMWKVKEIFDKTNYKMELIKEESDG